MAYQKSKKIFVRYGAQWPSDYSDLDVEMDAIRLGGTWADGQCGNGLIFHLKRMMTMLWPEDDWHRWAELALKEFCENTVTCLLGPKDANKTYIASKYGLCNYFCHPNDTLVLVSSTDMRGLELRVWGAIKGLYNRAVERYDHLPGNILESLHTITTDSFDPKAIGKKKGRVMNRGIICIPCLQSGSYVGLGKYHGIKQRRIIFIADEVGMMGESFLNAVANLSGKEFFKFIPIGNPNDPMNPLGQAAEPLAGWASVGEPTKTTVWRNKFMNGVTVNLVGTDSPNFDFPANEPPRYPYMMHRGKLEEVAAFWGTDSSTYFEQCVGIMKVGLLARRVITRDLCKQHHAFDPAHWEGPERTKVYAADIAYGGVGGDRAVSGWGEFGKADTGQVILRLNTPQIIPVSIRNTKIPEDQIADFMRDDLKRWDIPVENSFYDSTGRGTMGSAFARVFGSVIPNPIEFGGKPSKRPVRHDLFIMEDNEKRHKRCDEEYYDFVSELWLTSRIAIETDQIRELPDDVCNEGCRREYGRTKSNKKFVESKHDPKARERMGRSPDLYDWFVTLLEGARQRGFEIQRLGAQLIEKEQGEPWYIEAERDWNSVVKSKLLVHS